VANDVTLLIKLNDQASRLLAKITGNTKKLERANNSAQNSIRRINRGIKDTGRAAEKAAKGVGTLGKAVRGLVAGFGAFQAGKFVIFKTAELERQTKSLEVLTGSLGNARNIISELQQFGAVTPFTSSELIETAKRLKAFGFQTEEVVDVTKRLADVAGATGADLGGIATAFGQIQAKGRLQGEELLQLQERGVSLQDELQKMYGLTADEFRKALEGGRISADAVNLALQNITKTGGKYAGGAIAQSDTLAGKFSTLIDGIENISRAIGTVLSPALKGALGLAIDVVNSINAAINAQKRLSGFGISDDERNKLFRQATEEARQIALLRGGGKLDPGEFNRIKQQRFNDLISQFAFETGQLIPEIDKPITETKIPELLKTTTTTTTKSTKSTKLTEAERQEKINQKLVSQAQQEQATVADIVRARQQDNRLLEVAVDKGQEFADFTQRVLDLVNKGVPFSEAFELEDANRKLKQQLSDQAKFNQLLEQAGQVVQAGLVQGIQDAITGAKSLKESFSGILKQLGGMFLQAGIGSFGIGGKEGSGLLGLLPFAQGGFVDQPTRAVIGEGGESEYVIPSSKMNEAMGRYARGARGGAVIPDGPGGDASGGMTGGGGSIDVSYSVERINNVNYVTAAEFERGMAQAAKRGAELGRRNVYSDLVNKRSVRSRVGV